MKSIRRTLALALALLLCLSLLPANAFAEGKEVPATEKAVVKEIPVIRDDARTDQPQLQLVADPAIIFRSGSSFTLRTANNSVNWDGDLEYSTDARNWTLWHGETISSGLNNGRHCLYLRGTRNGHISASESERWVLTGNRISCTGNIEYLLDYQTVIARQHPQMGDYCFAYLFSGCSALVSAPKLPATTLTEGCYCSMFSLCSALKTAPSLPAKTLAPYCYASMFDLSGISTAPKLPATTLAEGCYCGMFNGCEYLTRPADLAATVLPDDCYFRMYSECTGIRLSEVQTDEYNIPYCVPSGANSQYVAPGALRFMFEHTGGTFTGTPAENRVYYLADPATPPEGMLTFGSDEPFTLRTANNAANWNGDLWYSTDTRNWTLWHGETISSGMHSGQQRLYVRGCGNDYISPSIFEDQSWVLEGRAISCMGDIENILDYGTVAAGDHPQMGGNCYHALFRGNTELMTAPELPATELTISCYYSMFEGCTSLKKAPKLSALSVKNSSYSYMFAYCSSLKTAPELPATELDIFCYEFMFYNCTSLVDAPALPAETLWADCYGRMFSGCTSLKTAPKLPAEKLAQRCYYGMFNGCTSLTTAPELPAKNLEVACYYGMFCDCTSLKNAPVLPADSVPYLGYLRMFENCTSLVQPPELPATHLSISCYLGMFNGCTSLAEVPALRANTVKSGCYAYMFQGCTSLTSVPALEAFNLPEGCYYAMFAGCTGIMLSEVETDEYSIPYSIPIIPDAGQVASDATTEMFENTGGTFTGTPEIEIIYYLHNSNHIVW